MKARLPRKLKKQVKKITVGSYCYSNINIGDYEKAVRMGKNLRTYKPSSSFPCPFGKHQTHCSLLNVHEYGLLPDGVKICGIYELKDAIRLKSKKGQEQIWYDEKGEPSMKFGKDNTIIRLK